MTVTSGTVRSNGVSYEKGMSFFTRFNSLPSVHLLTGAVSNLVKNNALVARGVEVSGDIVSKIVVPVYQKYENEILTIDSQATSVLEKLMDKYPILSKEPSELNSTIQNPVFAYFGSSVAYVTSVTSNLRNTGSSIKEKVLSDPRGYVTEVVGNTSQYLKQKVTDGQKLAVNKVNAVISGTYIESSLEKMNKWLASYVQDELKDPDVIEGLNEIPRSEPLNRFYYSINQLLYCARTCGAKTFIGTFGPIVNRIMYPIDMYKPLQHPLTLKLMILKEKHENSIMLQPIQAFIKAWSLLLFFDGNTLEKQWEEKDKKTE